MNSHRPLYLAFLVLGLFIAANAQADWIDSVTKALGISKTPSAMRGESGIFDGDIRVVGIDGSAPAALTAGGGYRSPIFVADDTAVLALTGTHVVRIPLKGGTPMQLHAVPGAVKLLGVDQNDAQKILLLVETQERGSELASLSLKTGKIIRLPHERSDRNQRILLSHLRGEDREYKELSLYLRPESKSGMGGNIEWKDVYMKRGTALPVNLSRCDGVDCRQPTLSHNRQRIVFIRATTGQ